MRAPGLRVPNTWRWARSKTVDRPALCPGGWCRPSGFPDDRLRDSQLARRFGSGARLLGRGGLSLVRTGRACRREQHDGEQDRYRCFRHQNVPPSATEATGSLGRGAQAGHVRGSARLSPCSASCALVVTHLEDLDGIPVACFQASRSGSGLARLDRSCEAGGSERPNGQYEEDACHDDGGQLSAQRPACTSSPDC